MWTLLLQLTMAFVFVKHRVASTQNGEGRGNASLTGINGVITSPRFPLSYPHNSRYVYSIDVDRTKTIGLFFYSFNLEGTSHDSDLDSCRYDWLLISCISTVSTRFRQNRKYCGAKTTPLLLNYTNCESFTLSFVSDSSVTGGGFKIWYSISSTGQSSCGNTSFSGPNGVITSPNFPLQYPYNFGCTYSINADRNRSVQLRFKYFNMGVPNSAGDCTHDWVKITCNETTKANPDSNRKFCGDIQWTSSMRFVDCQNLKLQFSSGASTNRAGFMIEYTVVDDSNATDDNYDDVCGYTSFSTPTGIVATPQLGFQLSRPVNCQYTIDVGNVSSVVLSIKDRLSFGNRYSFYYRDDSCRDGWLIITCLVNGTSMAHPLCQTLYGSMTARFPACQFVVFNFFGNDTSIDKGFRPTVRYRIGDYELDCGAKLINGSSGIINLPTNPTDYPVAVNCGYTIWTNRTGDILLDIDSISFSNEFLQSFQDCNTDNLTVGCVSEGRTQLNPSATRVFCRNSTSPYNFIFESELVFYDCSTLKMSIHSSTYGYYSADAYTPRFNFRVYGPDEICGNTSFSALAGIVATQKFSFSYMRHVSCLYTIDSGHVNSVVLSIDRLFLGSESDRNGSCNSGGWLTITCMSDGGASVAHPLADRKLCGNHEPTIARFTACRNVLLNLSSDYTSYHKGITIRYRLGDYDAECGNTSFSGSTGFITSPRFPLSYPHNLNCLYSIAGGERKAITLSFVSFRLGGRSKTPSIDQCSYTDFLTVSCLSDESVVANISSLRRYCGIKTTPLTFAFPRCAAVVLNFRSNWYRSVRQGGEFRVRYTVIDTDSIIGGNGNQDRYSSTLLPLTQYPSGRNHHHPAAALPER